jgi:hypothetical protein
VVRGDVVGLCCTEYYSIGGQVGAGWSPLEVNTGMNVMACCVFAYHHARTPGPCMYIHSSSSPTHICIFSLVRADYISLETQGAHRRAYREFVILYILCYSKTDMSYVTIEYNENYINVLYSFCCKYVVLFFIFYSISIRRLLA